MKVLSLMQPWASLAVMGIKQIETRSWTTAYRGELLIHAGKSKAGRSMMDKASVNAYIEDFNALPFGAIIGQVTLKNILLPPAVSGLTETDDRSLEANAFGPEQKKYQWIFEKAIIFDEVIPATGRLGLWEW